MADGHSAGQIILQLHDCIVPSDTLSDRQKSTICERLAVRRLAHCQHNALVILLYDAIAKFAVVIMSVSL